MTRYECDKCGACCQGNLIVEADDLDLMREPRLIESDPHWRGRTTEAVLHELQLEFGKAILIACGRACAFLGADNLCSIYPTRPNVCVGMQAGDQQCQEARAAENLPPLRPVDE
jgi:Fe-S-cluster containining protein